MNVDKLKPLFFKPESVLFNEYYRYFYKIASRSGNPLNMDNALIYATAYMLNKTGSGVSLFKATDIDHSFYRILVSIEEDSANNNRKIINIINCD